jgi:hypothetical protein
MYTNQPEIDPTITIRLAGPADLEKVRRLAERDSSSLPAGDLLVALADGEMRAALNLAGEAVADPFHPTDAIVSLLRTRVTQLHGGRPRGLRERLGALRGRRPRAGFSPQPAGTMRPE